MDGNVYKQACSVYDYCGDFEEACAVSTRKMAGLNVAAGTSNAVNGSTDIAEQPGSSRIQSNDSVNVADPESESETAAYIPGVGMRSPAQSQVWTSAMFKVIPKVIPKLTITLNVCLLGIAIFLMLTTLNLKLSVNQLDQTTGVTAVNQANVSVRLQQAMGKMAELAGKAEENEKALRNIGDRVDQLTHSDLLGILANETKLLQELECKMENPEDQSEGPPLPTELPGPCPKGYKDYRKVCYKLFDERKSFSESAETCQADGGTLAMPRDRGINAFLVSLMHEEDICHGIWFGLHDRRQEGEWEWIDGAALGTGARYRGWAPTQPNSQGREDDCAAYSTDLWYDVNCRMKESFICEVILPPDTSDTEPWSLQLV